jgi:hypothetical protein
MNTPSINNWGHFGSRLWRAGGISTLGATLAVAVLVAFELTPQAQALPSFARQTGQPCGTCHTDFPALTPFGRRFKLLGYTTGGGKFRTTPWLGAEDFRAAADRLRGFVKASDSGQEEADKVWVPPLSMMAIPGYTHTQAPLTPPTAPYGTNDNWVLANPFSVFWGGAVTDHIGAFAQVTYAPPDPGISRISSGTPGRGTTPTFVMPMKR